MVASSPSAQVYTPQARPQLAVAGDGTLAAIHEPTRVVVVELPSCAPFAELQIDPQAEACELGWVGTPPRLLVLSRASGSATVHLVDPFGPRTIAELRVDTPLQLFGIAGSHALVVGPNGAAILTAADTALSLHPFPARTMPVTAGAAGNQLVVALAGSIEEWDPQNRMPKRRLKLPRPADITAVGGSDRVVWMTTQQTPNRIDVIPFVNRGQPKTHDLPEDIASIASHPRSDLVVCLGARSGRVWVIDLDGRAGLRMIGPEGISRVDAAALVLGRVAGVLAAQAERPLAVVSLERSDTAPASPRAERSSSEEVEDVPTDVTRGMLAHEQAARSSAGRWDMKPTGDLRTAGARVADVRASEDLQLSAFRERVANQRARTAEPVATLWPDASPMWREEALAWAQSSLGGIAGGEAPISIPFGTLVTRFELAPQVQPVLAFLYGLHLMGIPGAAPVELSRLLGSWDDALGRGELAARGVIETRDSRVHLAASILRVLDERAPLTGTIIGIPGVVSLLGPCTIVSTSPLTIVAEACSPVIGGAILAAEPEADPRELVHEARAYGAAPMLRVTPGALERVPTSEPIILVVADDATADQLGVPRLS